MLAQAQNLKLPQTNVIATQIRSQQFRFEQVWTPGIGHSMPIFPGVVVHLHRLQAPPPRGGVTADKPAKEQVKREEDEDVLLDTDREREQSTVET